MIEVRISELAEEELSKMDAQLRLYFKKHIEKIVNMPTRRHMRYGLPFNVVNVTKQSRLVYQVEDDRLFILRCFATHKEYERWYLSFK
ncbi:MAG: hypothetical protein ABH842_05010 [Candidatus Micrarchaeota archaeon]